MSNEVSSTMVERLSHHMYFLNSNTKYIRYFILAVLHRLVGTAIEIFLVFTASFLNGNSLVYALGKVRITGFKEDIRTTS